MAYAIVPPSAEAEIVSLDKWRASKRALPVEFASEHDVEAGSLLAGWVRVATFVLGAALSWYCLLAMFGAV